MIKQSKFPFIFGSVCSGAMIVGMISQFGNWTDSHKIFLVGAIILLLGMFSLMLYFTIFTPDIIRFVEDDLVLRCISLNSKTAIIPIDSISYAEETEFQYDSKMSGIKLILKENEKISKYKSEYKSWEYFGFKDNCFYCAIWGSSDRAKEAVKIINSKIESKG